MVEPNLPHHHEAPAHQPDDAADDTPVEAPVGAKAPPSAGPRPSDEPSTRQRILAAILGVVLLGLVAGYALLPAAGSYEIRAIVHELSVIADEVILAPCELTEGGTWENPSDLMVNMDEAQVVTQAQREALSHILDRDRVLFMGRLTRPDPECWEPHHVIIFRTAEGGELVLQLSLSCGWYKPGGPPPKPLPAIWHWRLKQWLRDVEASGAN